jgi:hypothetical protein
MTRARVSALMHGGTSQASGSPSGAQVVSGPSVATPLPGSLSQLSTDIDEERTPFAEGALSPVGPSLHGNLRGTNTQLITQNTSRLPIVQSRVETIRTTGSATRVAPARLTASNLEQYTHLNSHNLSDIRHGASSQQSEDTEAVERVDADFVHRTIEDRSDRSCECVDGCRTSDCTCVLTGTLCSLNCRCNIDTGDDDRRGGCFSPLRRFNDRLLRHHYFGASSHRTVNFSKCFASRVLAFLSGELSIASIQGGPQRPSHRLISSAEMSLIEKLPAFELKAEFVEWVRQSQSMNSYNHKRWLLRIALGEGHGIQDQWKFSFCEKSGCTAVSGCIALRVVGATGSTQLRRIVMIDVEREQSCRLTPYTWCEAFRYLYRMVSFQWYISFGTCFVAKPIALCLSIVSAQFIQ